MARISAEHSQEHDKQIVILIDKKDYKVSNTPHTAGDILHLRFGQTADVNLKILTLRHGNDVTKFEDQSAIVPLENGMQFVVLDKSPTTVS